MTDPFGDLRGGRTGGAPRALLLLGWVSAAATAARSGSAPTAPPPPPAALGPAARQPPSSAPTQPPRRRAPPRPLRILAEIESVFVAEQAAAPPDSQRSDSARGRRDWRRELPRPFAALRLAASPLIMPRLALPRVLAPDFVALRGLAARARPGEAVQVRLTAYCLRGRTRQGTPTRPGVVAADPRIFPLDRTVHLFAAGRYLGRFRVEDTGSAVRGPHIDIWTPDCADARRFGSRPGMASLVGFGRD